MVRSPIRPDRAGAGACALILAALLAACGASARGELAVAPAAGAVDGPSAREAALAAGDYLRRVVRDDGQFIYRYDVITGEDLGGYNMVRHAGAAHAMLEAWEVDRDPELLAAARRALDVLERASAPWPLDAGDGAPAAFVPDGDKIKLGGVALAALAMATHDRATGDQRYRPLAQALCRYLVANLGDDGAFVHQRDRATGEVIDFDSQYYPGEAILALVRLHAIDGDEAWLEPASRAAHYLADVRDRGRADDDLPHDHWLLYALADLERSRPDPDLRAHAMRIARIIARTQHDQRGPQPGAWDADGRSTPAATRLEGLLAALPLAEGSDADVALIGGAIRRGIEFLLRTQLTAARARASGLDANGIGAFTDSLTGSEARIDYSQHALSALLAYDRARRAGRL